MTQEERNEEIICPLCGNVTAEPVCENCKEDLRLLRETQNGAVKCYNLAVELIHRKSKDDWRLTEECLNLAIMLDAGFIPPYIVLGKLCALQRRYSEAISNWTKALNIDRDNKDAKAYLQGIRSLFEGKETLRLESSWRGKPIRLGSRVQDSTGRLGRIWRLIPDDERQPLTHIVVWTDSFSPEDALIPVELIIGVEGDIVLIGEKLWHLLHRMPKYRSGNGHTNSGISPISETKPGERIK